VPVASTFTPTKGKASNVRREQLPYNFQNYARLGVGNYFNILGQFFGTVEVNQYQSLDIEFDHLSSSGGIQDVVLDDNFIDSSLDLKFKSSERYFNWNAGFNMLYKSFNWYGVDQSLIVNPNTLFAQDISTIDPLQTYFGIGLNGQVEFEESVVNQASIAFQNFSDAYSSSENNIILDADFSFPISDSALDLNFNLDYLSGGFDQFYNGIPNLRGNLDYGLFTTTLSPSYQITSGDFNLDLGLKATYFSDSEASESEFFFYPNINSSYNLAENMIVYAGVEGGLNKNSYLNLVQQNPFVSPTLEIQPTDNAFTGFLGINGMQGKLAYNVKAFGRQDNNNPFFVENRVVNATQAFVPLNNFEFSNSFEVLYDDLFTLGLTAEVDYTVLDDFNVGFSGTYRNFDVSNLPEASYLPEIELNLNVNYQISEKWFLNSTLFYVGNRESVGYTNTTNTVDLFSQTLDGFVDFNLGVDFQLSQQLGLFIKGQNLFGNNYQQWQNFDVQGLQVMGGLSYQFDW
jgi:outer membrane protein W